MTSSWETSVTKIYAHFLVYHLIPAILFWAQFFLVIEIITGFLIILFSAIASLSNLAKRMIPNFIYTLTTMRLLYSMFPCCDVIRSWPLRILTRLFLCNSKGTKLLCVAKKRSVEYGTVTWLSHDNSCDCTVAKQRVASNPFENPVAMMGRGFKCEAFLAKWSNS